MNRPSRTTFTGELTFPFSKLAINFISSIGQFTCLADFYLRAFKNVSGWNRSDKLSFDLIVAPYSAL